MDLEENSESTCYASKLYQAVLSLKPSDLAAGHRVHRMAKALALVEMMSARSQSPADVLNHRNTH